MGEFSEDFYEYRRENEIPVTCKYCGRESMFWAETMQGWRLFTPDGHLHECKKPYNNEGENNDNANG